MVNTVSFEDSPLWPEVNAIAFQKKPATHFEYKATVHTEKEDFGVYDLNSVENHRDYLHDIGECVRVTFKMGAGDYVSRLYPYRNHLEMTLKRIPLQRNQDQGDVPILITRYKVIFDTQRNMPVAGGELENHQPSDLNISDMVEVYFELVDRSLEPLRIKTTGGAFRNVKVSQLIQGLMGVESDRVRVDGKPAVQGLDLVPPDNTDLLSNVVIPHGTRMTSIPTWLQARFGVYNRGLGTYFQSYQGRKLWFVYPTYDSERFDTEHRKAVFYAVPQEKFPQLDKTFLLEGEVLKVAVTAQRRYIDSDLGSMNQGSGYRMADARSFMKKPVILTEDGPKAQRQRLNHEVALTDRSDGLNYAPRVSGPSANPFFQRSEVLARQMGQIDFVWENADPEQIYPGMPCKFIYLSQGKAKSLKGCILFVHALSARIEKQGASTFSTTCRLTIACDPMSELPDLPTSTTPGQ